MVQVEVDMKIKWLGHSSFLIEADGRRIYVDPHALGEKADPADIILITHDHFDHCDPHAVKRISKTGTRLLGSESASRRIKATGVLKPKDTIRFGGIRIKAVHAYNLDGGFHPPGRGIGFVIEAEGKRVYHAGDTDQIPEMEELVGIDVAILPIGGRYTMGLDEAAEAVKTMRPKIAIPMHYGGFVSSRAEADSFKLRVERESKTRVEIPGPTPLTL